MQSKEKENGGMFGGNREAIAKLAASAQARELVRLLNQQGGVQQAAQAAAGGDPGALTAMLEGLMRSEQGADLIRSIEEQAKRAGIG